MCGDQKRGKDSDAAWHHSGVAVVTRQATQGEKERETLTKERKKRESYN